MKGWEKSVSEKPLSLREIQQENFKVLCRVDEICRELGLQYYLAYGTLLGLIRHGDFIPWDDDLDIWMPRRDFNILREYFRREGSRLWPLKFCCRENTDNYEFYIPRISNMEFQYRSRDQKKKTIDIGTFVDVYPLDYCGNTGEEAQKTYEKMRKINALYSVYINAVSYSENRVKRLLKFLAHVCLRVIKGSGYRFKIDGQMEARLEKAVEGGHRLLGVPTWSGYGEYCPREWFEECQEKSWGGAQLLYSLPV